MSPIVELVAIIALAAGGLFVIMVAITPVKGADSAKPRAPSAPPPQPQRLTIQRGSAPWALSDAPSPRETPEAATPRPQKPPRRPTWHGIPRAWKSWRYRHADALRGAGWPAAAVALSVVVAYLIVQI